MSELLKYKIQKVQNTCTRFIFGLKKFDHISSHFAQLQTLNMEERRLVHGLTTMHKIVTEVSPDYLISKITFHNNLHDYNTRNKNKIVVGASRTTTYDKSYFPTFSRLYNSLSNTGINMNVTADTMRKKAKTFVIAQRV